MALETLWTVLAVAVQHNALNMLPIQAAKPHMHIGFGVANRMKNNGQLKSVTVVFIVLFFLQMFVFDLYYVDVVKNKYADLPVVKDLFFDLFGK